MTFRRRIVAMLVLVVSSAAPFLAQQAPPPPPKPQGDQADVPLVFRGPQPALDVMVNGKGPFRFAFDTAASGVGRVDTGLVTKLNLETVGEARASDGAGAVVTIPIVRVNEFAFGGLSWKTADMASRDYNAGSPLPPIDGILGLQGFAGMVVTLDLPHHRLRAVRGSLPEPDGKTVLAWDPRRPVPAVMIDVDGHNILADIDTGNVFGDGPNIPGSLVPSLKFAAAPEAAGKARTVSGTTSMKRAVLNGRITIGGVTIDNPPVFFADGLERMNIGMAVLKDFVLSIDVTNRRVKIER